MIGTAQCVFSENILHQTATINDITKRNVSEAADCAQLRQIAPTLTFSPNPGGNKLTVSANNTVSCSQNRFAP
jgi:hypothetical protein